MKYVYLEWIDSVSSGGWQKHEVRDMSVTSVGILVAEDKTSITISTSVYGRTSESPLTIPKVAIKKRKNKTWQL